MTLFMYMVKCEALDITLLYLGATSNAHASISGKMRFVCLAAVTHVNVTKGECISNVEDCNIYGVLMINS